MNLDKNSVVHGNELDQSYSEKEDSLGTNYFSDGTESIKDSTSKFTFSTDLTESDTSYEHGIETSERTTMDFTTIDTDSNGICEEFEFSIKEDLSKSAPSLSRVIGIYTLQNYFRYNDKVVYYNNKMGVYLYYKIFKNNETRPFNKSFRYPDAGGMWVIIPSSGAHRIVLVDNPYCLDVEYPANGECQFGWYHFSESGNNYKYDSTSHVMCRKPKPITSNLQDNAICTKFELSSRKEFVSKCFGEYQMMNISHNGRVAYQKLNTINNNSVYLYSLTTDHDIRIWAIGPILGSKINYALNSYCSGLEYPTNQNCNTGWFDYSEDSQSWQYDSSMAMKCMAYHFE